METVIKKTAILSMSTLKRQLLNMCRSTWRVQGRVFSFLALFCLRRAGWLIWNAKSGDQQGCLPPGTKPNGYFHEIMPELKSLSGWFSWDNSTVPNRKGFPWRCSQREVSKQCWAMRKTLWLSMDKKMRSGRRAGGWLNEIRWMQFYKKKLTKEQPVFISNQILTWKIGFVSMANHWTNNFQKNPINMFKLKKLVIRVNKYSTNPIKIFEFTNQGFPGELILLIYSIQSLSA